MTEPAAWWLASTLTGAVALAAWRAGSLRRDGAVTAFVIGVLALHTGWGWGTFLVSWFVLASALSRVGRARKAERTRDIVMKGDRRDAVQVLANGGVFAICALIVDATRGTASSALTTMITVGAAGALAAAGADTWSTEIGTLWGGPPWSLRTGQRVPAGTSGAVTLGGTVGGVCGALAIATLAWAVGMIPVSLIGAVVIGGIAGATADTILGAWGQERRWCPQCDRATERVVHDCGSRTEHRGGIRKFDNDLVNGACTLAGAVVAGMLAARVLGPA